MIVDSSAIVAILTEEPEALAFASAITNADARISAGNWIELAAVTSRRRLCTAEELDQLRTRFGLTIESVTAEQAGIGQAAYRSFGIGSGHPARLNFGDCFAYALAKATGEPLLFKGDDFVHTDIPRV
ncbi:MAG: type II toxin-antitoxin system VapC family toxin [Sphingomonas sp.]